jgi:hypothetical protein
MVHKDNINDAMAFIEQTRNEGESGEIE